MLWVKKLKPARNQCLVYRYIGQFAEELEQEQKIPVPTILLVPSMVPSTEFLSADLRLTGNSGNKEIRQFPISGSVFYWAGNWQYCLFNSEIWFKEGNSEESEGEYLGRYFPEEIQLS